jgi:hypothetical protein
MATPDLGRLRTVNEVEAVTDLSDFSQGPASTGLRSETPKCSVSAIAENSNFAPKSEGGIALRKSVA